MKLISEYYYSYLLNKIYILLDKWYNLVVEGRLCYYEKLR